MSNRALTLEVCKSLSKTVEFDIILAERAGALRCLPDYTCVSLCQTKHGKNKLILSRTLMYGLEKWSCTNRGMNDLN